MLPEDKLEFSNLRTRPKLKATKEGEVMGPGRGGVCVYINPITMIICMYFKISKTYTL